MREFHISDVLSVTTGRLVSNRHMDGVYDILNYLTGESLFTHQLPEASDVVGPWLAEKYPQLMDGHREMMPFLASLKERLIHAQREEMTATVANWVECVRSHFSLPEMLPLEPMPKERMPERYMPKNLRESLAKAFADAPVIAVAAPEKD